MNQKNHINPFCPDKIEMIITSVSTSKLEASTTTKIYFVLLGQLQLLHNGKSILLKKGDIYIVNNHALVAFMSETNNRVMITTVNFDKQYQLTNPLSTLYMNEAYEKIAQLLASTFLEIQTKQPGFEQIVEGNTLQLKGLFSRYIPVRKAKDIANELNTLSDKNRQLIDYINNHYDENITLDSLADYFFISKYYLAHSFKKQIGITIGTYIKEIRLIHAQMLIEQTNLPINEVVNATGFSNTRSFNDSFKHKFNLSPTSYRKKYQQEKVNQSIVIDDNETNTIKLLNEYAKSEEITPTETNQIKEIVAQIDTKSFSNMAPNNIIFIRLQDITSEEKLEAIKKLNVTPYVSITNIIDIIKCKFKNGQLTFNTQLLVNAIKHIEGKNLIPYFQISFLDYEKVVALSKNETLFYEIFNQIICDLEREFNDITLWYVEFRCFYEFKHSGKLCTPVKNLIPRFKDFGQLVIHLPIQPILQMVDDPCNETVLVIDDRAIVKEYSYQTILENLDNPRYIDIISENRNIPFQLTLDERMKQLEKDIYYNQFTDLIYANQMLWLFLQGRLIKEKTFEPLSLDGTPIFTYFPKDVSKNMSILSSNGIRNNMWYAYQFRKRLFHKMIYQNDFCIVTKQGESYRLLAIYPEEEMIITLFKNNVITNQEPSLKLKFIFNHINGSYQITEQTITPVIENKKNKLRNFKNSKKLSSEMIAYLDDISQPLMTSKEEIINNYYDLSLTLPVFGISYIEINKI